jgi:hypothetical protein
MERGAGVREKQGRRRGRVREMQKRKERKGRRREGRADEGEKMGKRERKERGRLNDMFGSNNIQYLN